MLEEEPVPYFVEVLTQNPNLSVSLAAIKTLIHVIKTSNSETISGLDDHLKSVIEQLKNARTQYLIETSVTSITSGCELLRRFITLAAPEALLSRDFSETKRVLVERGNLFAREAENSRPKIAKLSQQFIRDGSVILTHSSSRVVCELLIEAFRNNKRFMVYCTESTPQNQGLKTQQVLAEHNIPCTVILDSAVGYVMERVDMVLLGAEAVVESGGIINRIGSFQMAVVAKAMNKPVYAAAESYKFLRQFPVKQREIPNAITYQANEDGHPLVDYTPPNYIALLFTDLGVLTPSAVSDELIKLYL